MVLRVESAYEESEKFGAVTVMGAGIRTLSGLRQ